jgi:hypothetical protein
LYKNFRKRYSISTNKNRRWGKNMVDKKKGLGERIFLDFLGFSGK